MKRPFHAFVSASTLMVAMLTPAAAETVGAQYAQKTKITMTAARDTALKARPGRITGQELEHENGGSGLRYSFDIVEHGTRYEVGVDAKTGAVLKNGKEEENPD